MPEILTMLISWNNTQPGEVSTTVGLQGHVEVSLKWGFEPRVTLGGFLSEQNLELLMGQFYTSTTLMYSRGNFKPVQKV